MLVGDAPLQASDSSQGFETMNAYRLSISLRENNLITEMVSVMKEQSLVEHSICISIGCKILNQN